MTEGGADFDLVQQVEAELEPLPDKASGSEVYRASKVAAAFDEAELAMFRGLKTWAK